MQNIALVDTKTGEFIPAGTHTLDSCASEALEIIAGTEKNNWRLGQILSIARALCDDEGFDDDLNPNERYGAWVSAKFSETSSRSLLNIRRLHEIFGHRRQAVENIPQSGLYALAQPQCDDIREEVIPQLTGRVTCAMVEEKIGEALGKDVIALKHTGDEESYTPSQYIESARHVMGGINLDPASNDMAQETVKADDYFTVDDNGLEHAWTGTVWLNPPYTTKVIDCFIDKLADHFEAGDVIEAVLLTNNNTDTQWFLRGAKAASAICFTTGRINFLKRDGSTSSPTNGQSFFYFGKNKKKFTKEFSQYGLVMVLA